MFRSDFTFLDRMFHDKSFREYQLLIVNQTDTEKQLVSGHKNIRVINSLERGLSRSRNIALNNAIGEICLFADDDVQYERNVEEIVVSAFAKAKKASLITFQMENRAGKLYKEYPKIKQHTLTTIKNVSSVEIAFRRKEVQELGVRFNTHFGLGAIFPIGEEYIFLRSVIERGGVCFFEPKVLLQHPEASSGQFPENNQVIFARGALRYRYMGSLAFLSMIKYAWFYYRRGRISFREMPSKIATGFAGIKKYKNLS